MKKVISGDELKESIEKAIDLICNAVSSTLGPSGNNVIINSDLNPYITNDGVTIARNIASDNDVINTILDIIKESSFKTENEVGDGTTTTLVLLQSIYKQGIKYTSKINPIIIKNELNKSLNKVLNYLNNIKKNPTKKDFINIASTSVEDKETGKLIANIYNEVKNKYAIKLEEAKDEKTVYEIKKGYTLEIEKVSNLLFKNNDEIIINNCNVLILNCIDNIENISCILNDIIKKNKSLIILVKDYEEDVSNQILEYYLDYNKKIFLFKMINYGSMSDDILNDLLSITGATIGNNKADFKFLGNLKKVIIRKDELSLITDTNNSLYINNLKNKLTNITNEYDKEILESRIANLESGIATIFVGGHTKTEIREKLMRYEDALCALDVSKKGVIYGEGISLLESCKILSDTIGDEILINSLSAPFEKIITNCGLDDKIIKDKIIKSNYQLIYNPTKHNYEDITATEIIDPILVIIQSLKNAISIASLLLTTNYLVINENNNNNNDLY